MFAPTRGASGGLNGVMACSWDPVPRAPGPVAATPRSARVVALAAYGALLGAWVGVIGVPNDTLQVFAWLWLGTVAWNVRAPWRSHLGFLRDWWLPVAGLVIYFFSRGLTDELGLPVHVRSRSPSTSGWAPASRPRSDCRRRGAATRASRTARRVCSICTSPRSTRRTSSPA